MPLQLGLFDVPAEPPRPPGRVLIAAGSLAAEALLLERLSPRVAAFEAIGAEAECREVARRVRVLLDGGARAEGIAVVARDSDFPNRVG